MDNTNQLRNLTILEDFFKECCLTGLDVGYKVGVHGLYLAFKKWHEENVSQRVIDRKEFENMIGNRFEMDLSKDGFIFYHGLKLLSNSSRIPEVSIESQDFSIELPKLIGQVEFLAESFLNASINKGFVPSSNFFWGSGSILDEIVKDLNIINEALYPSI